MIADINDMAGLVIYSELWCGALSLKRNTGIRPDMRSDNALKLSSRTICTPPLTVVCTAYGVAVVQLINKTLRAL